MRARWAWGEPTVWSERMLEALEQGVKGGVWFSLIDKVYAARTLAAAWRQVPARAGAGGVDRQTVEQFATHAETRLSRLSAALRTGTSAPQPVRRCWIDKPGSGEQRPLGIPTVTDRVVQTAIRLVLEPIFEREVLPSSYGFRPGRGCKDALREVQRQLDAGATWVVDADIKSYFDTIPHAPLRAGEALAPEEESAQAEGHRAPPHAAHARSEPGGHCRRAQSGAARLVRLLPALASPHLPVAGRVAPHAVA
jgi:RNA-directed DNA polymerase